MKFYKENKINPYASCLPIVFQIPIFIALFFVLRDFEDEVFCSPELGGDDELRDRRRQPAGAAGVRGELEWLNLVNITADTIDGWGPLLLVVYVVSQLTSTWLMSTSMQSAAQRWLIMLLPIFFIPFILEFPSGLMIYWLTTNLWSTGQGLVTRRLMPRPVTPAEALEPHAAEGGHGRRRTEARATGRPRSRRRLGTGPPRRVKRKKGGGGASDERATAKGSRVEATGETVGEAKWTALRELEQLVPGLDRDSVAVRRPHRGRARPPRRRIHAGAGRRERSGGGRRGAGEDSDGLPHRRASSSTASRRRSGPSVTVDRVGARRRRDGDVHGRRPRPPHREARPDDRRDPVPRERGRALGGRRARRRRRRGRLSRAARATLAACRRSLGAPGGGDGQPGRARPDDGRSSGRSCTRRSRKTPRSRRGARAPSRTATSSSCRVTSRTDVARHSSSAGSRTWSRRPGSRALDASEHAASCSTTPFARCRSSPQPAGRSSTSAPAEARPGIPLAVALPDRAFTLLEAQRRKAQFLERDDGRARERRGRLGPRRGAAGRRIRRSRSPRRSPSRRSPPSSASRSCGRAGSRSSGSGRRPTLDAVARVAELLARDARGRRGRACSSLRKLAPTPPGFPRRAGMAAKRPLA